MTTDINSFSNKNHSNSSNTHEITNSSQVEDVVKKTDLFQLPTDVTTLILRKLRPIELDTFQVTNTTSFSLSKDLKISHAHEFGYDRVDAFGSNKFLQEIYREIEDLKDVIPKKYLADDPETTLRNLQNLTIDDCFEIFKEPNIFFQCGKIYGPNYQKTRNYLIKITDQVFSKSDKTIYKAQMNTMMRGAIAYGSLPMISLLLNHGVDIENTDTPNADDPCPALLYACRDSTSLDVVELLLSRGANIHAQYANRSNVFVFLNEGGRPEFCLAARKLFLNRGVDPNIGDFAGNTPLHYAIQKKDYAFMQLLLMHGADIRQPNNAGETPLSSALKSWDFRMVNMCLLGFDPYAED